MMTRLTTRRLGLMIAGLAGSAIALVAGQQPSGAPVLAAQATAGRAAYQANCASCHVADLVATSPQLAGGDFMNTRRSRTTKDLFDYMSSTMPPAARRSRPISMRASSPTSCRRTAHPQEPRPSLPRQPYRLEALPQVWHQRHGQRTQAELPRRPAAARSREHKHRSAAASHHPIPALWA